MKKLIFIGAIVIIFSLNCYGYDYDISGTDSEGGYVYGEVEVDQDGGDGYIYTDDGEEKHIDVEWTGHGEMEGYDEEGNYYELEVE